MEKRPWRCFFIRPLYLVLLDVMILSCVREGPLVPLVLFFKYDPGPLKRLFWLLNADEGSAKPLFFENSEMGAIIAALWPAFFALWVHLERDCDIDDVAGENAAERFVVGLTMGECAMP